MRMSTTILLISLTIVLGATGEKEPGHALLDGALDSFVSCPPDNSCGNNESAYTHKFTHGTEIENFDCAPNTCHQGELNAQCVEKHYWCSGGLGLRGEPAGRAVLAALESATRDDVRYLLNRHPGKIVVNSARGAIQVLDCRGDVVLSVPNAAVSELLLLGS